jgi:glycosyltransferase involved in cell wall biosynthesis
MQAAYQTRYGVEAEVLYPIRDAEMPLFDAPPEQLRRADGQFTVAFAGSINSTGYVKALVTLQGALEAIDGRLLIFGPLTADEAQQLALHSPCTIVRGMLTARELMTRLREEAHALFVPMSFEPVDRANMELAFPSKLADYTAVGLPLVIYGPSYCSAVGWARENPGVAEIVEARDGLTEVVQRLANDPLLRHRLGMRALEAGRKYFTHETVQTVFNQALKSSVDRG